MPHRDFVLEWGRHEKGLFEDGDVSGSWGVSSTQIEFLCRAIEATSNFENPLQLAVFVRTYREERSISHATIVNYLIKLDKFVRYVKTYKRSTIPVIMQNDWTQIIKDTKARYQKGSLKEKKKSKKRKFLRVPDMEEAAEVCETIFSLCNADVEEKTLALDELKAFNFVTLSCNTNGRPGPLNYLTWSS